MADAARVLADRFGCSLRQARRYVDRAVAGGPMPVAESAVVFSIKLKLPAALAIRVREHARDSGSTLSEVVSQALAEFLVQGRTRPGGR
ncbi:ribbon-helix-helix protein, CopG family [Nocardia pseudovaccinii]|uniref:ribbon-helix-helix protein, CopG family n=1 Tax=Nocardia pseudovaccinii TaxID=189540 RepID=UPI001C3F5436|nr:ribbon-helix-helix protein, CopG family [Nocardia pseudovaccinii]